MILLLLALEGNPPSMVSWKRLELLTQQQARDERREKLPQTDRQTDGQTDRQADRQTGRQWRMMEGRFFFQSNARPFSTQGGERERERESG